MTKNKDLRVEVVAADKGGAKKTTLIHNKAEYLAYQGYSVCLIGEDRSRNLTKRYILDIPAYRSTVIALYDGLDLDVEAKQTGTLVPLHVKENIDLIAETESKQMIALEERLMNRIQRELILFKWIAKNYEELNAHYDYILIDTRNDEGVLTLNALAAADVVIGITDMSVDGYEALDSLKRKVSELNEAYDNQAKLVFVAGGIVKGDKVLKSGRVKMEDSTREILEMLQPRPEYIGAFSRSTEMANPETLFERAHHNHRFAIEQGKIISELKVLFETIQEVLDHGE